MMKKYFLLVLAIFIYCFQGAYAEVKGEDRSIGIKILFSLDCLIDDLNSSIEELLEENKNKFQESFDALNVLWENLREIYHGNLGERLTEAFFICDNLHRNFFLLSKEEQAQQIMKMHYLLLTERLTFLNCNVEEYLTMFLCDLEEQLHSEDIINGSDLEKSLQNEFYFVENLIVSIQGKDCRPHEENEERDDGDDFFEDEEEKPARIDETEGALSSNINNNPLLPAEVKKEILPYVISKHHPMKHNLDAIFSKTRATLTDETLIAAGFTIHYKQPRSFIRVVSHPLLPNYFVKLILDSEPMEKHGFSEWYWFANRCKNAQQIEKIIKQNNIKHFTVPHKYIYVLPKHPKCPNDSIYKQKYTVLLVKKDGR